jgi:hypothetical protein
MLATRRGEGVPVMPSGVRWPEGRTFAFTVFDDTDLMTTQVGERLYGVLAELGFRTTKSVWPIRSATEPTIGGTTCAEPRYRAWVQGLQRQGFEVALHGVSYATATRDEVRCGLDRFRDYFGHDPHSHANHADARDSIYWGDARLTGAARLPYRALKRSSARREGHLPGSPYFWGDLCRERVTYVRNFVFGGIDTLAACPAMPYHDPDRPFVNYWFAGSEGADARSFVRTVSEANQDRLEAEGGACIMYTHFAAGFVQDGRVDPRFVRLMTRLSRKGGWFVPVTDVLDHLRQEGRGADITRAERGRLQRNWLLHKVRTRGTT